MRVEQLCLLLAACGPRHASPPPVHSAPPYEVIYFAMVDRFANGVADVEPVSPQDPHGWHGGDLVGVLGHLEAIQSLGATAVWLTPLTLGRQTAFKGWGAFHGYWMHDPGRIDPRFGTEADLVALTGALHARDMRLLVDVVYNHVDYDAPVVASHPDWFHTAPAIEDWNDPWQRVNGQVHGLPDLDQDHPEVYAWLRDATERWLELGVDGLRIDAVRHLPGAFLVRLEADLEARLGKPVHTLGEIFEGDPVTLARSWRSTTLDAVFDFPLHYAMVDVFCDGAPVGRLASVLAADRLHPHPEALVTFLDNHDLPRIQSRCRGDGEAVSSALAFMLTARGTPAITWGTEARQEGEHEPANRGDMEWDAPMPRADEIRGLLEHRRDNPALRAAGSRILHLDADLLVVERRAAGQAALIAVGTGPPVYFPLPPWFVAAAPEAIVGAAASGDRWPIGPGVRVLVTRGAVSAPPPDPVASRAVRLMAPLADGWRVAGAPPELGAWDPAGGVPFVDGVATVHLPVGSVAEFKLVRPSSDGHAWEVGPNRFLLVPAGQGPWEARVVVRSDTPALAPTEAP